MYSFTYDGTNPPKWEKNFTANSGETFAVSLVFENEEDRLELSAEQVFEYLDLMLQYVKDRTQGLSIISLTEDPPETQWPLHGNYVKIEDTMLEIQKWWMWAYYNDAFDTEDVPDEESV